MVRLAGTVSGQSVLNVGPLFRRAPLGLMRMIGNKYPPQRRRYHKRKDAFNDKQPAPVGEGQKLTRQRRGNDRGNGDVHDPECIGACPFRSREPVTDEHKNRGPYASLGYAEEKPD